MDRESHGDSGRGEGTYGSSFEGPSPKKQKKENFIHQRGADEALFELPKEETGFRATDVDHPDGPFFELPESEEDARERKEREEAQKLREAFGIEEKKPELPPLPVPTDDQGIINPETRALLEKNQRERELITSHKGLDKPEEREFFEQTKNQTLQGLDEEHSRILAQQDIVNEIAANQVIGFSMKRLGEMREAIAEYEKKGAISKVWGKLGFTKSAREEQSRIFEYKKIVKQVDDHVNETITRQKEARKLRAERQHAAEQAEINAGAREAIISVREQTGAITPEQVPIERVQAEIKEEFGVSLRADGSLPEGPRNKGKAFGLEFYNGDDEELREQSQRFRDLWSKLIGEGQKDRGETQDLVRRQQRSAVGAWARRAWTAVSLTAGLIATEELINPKYTAATLDPSTIERVDRSPREGAYVDYQLTPEMSQHEFGPMKLTGKKPLVSGEKFAPNLGKPVAQQKSETRGTDITTERINPTTGKPVTQIESRDVYKLKDGRTVVVLEHKDRKGQPRRDYIFRKSNGPWIFDRLVSTDENSRVINTIDVFDGELHTRDRVWYKIHRFNEITQTWEVAEKHPIPQRDRSQLMGELGGKKLEGDEKDQVVGEMRDQMTTP